MSTLVMVTLGAVALLSIRMLVESKTSAVKATVKSKLDEVKSKRTKARAVIPTTADLVSAMNNLSANQRQQWEVQRTTGQFGRAALRMKRREGEDSGALLYRMPTT
jgi:hypothetical protein